MPNYPESSVRKERVSKLVESGWPQNDAWYLSGVHPGRVVTFTNDPEAKSMPILRGTVKTVDWEEAEGDPQLTVRQHPFGFRLLSVFGNDTTVNLNEILVVE